MKKLLSLSLLVFALIATTLTFAKNDSESSLSLSWPLFSSSNTECVKAAVEKRETSIIDSATTFQTSILSWLNTRKTDLLAARSLTTKSEVKLAVKKARDKYKSVKKLAKETLKKWEKSALKIYKKDIKACKISNKVDEIGQETESTISTIE